MFSEVTYPLTQLVILLRQIIQIAWQNVIMCHLSSENADRDSFIEKMKKVVWGDVDVAERNKEWVLRKGDECPF